MSSSTVPENADLARRARISTHNGVPAGVCLVLSQAELQNFGVDPDACESVCYYLQSTHVDGDKVSVLRLVESQDTDGSIAD